MLPFDLSPWRWRPLHTSMGRPNDPSWCHRGCRSCIIRLKWPTSTYTGGKQVAIFDSFTAGLVRSIVRILGEHPFQQICLYEQQRTYNPTLRAFDWDTEGCRFKSLPSQVVSGVKTNGKSTWGTGSWWWPLKQGKAGSVVRLLTDESRFSAFQYSLSRGAVFGHLVHWAEIKQSCVWAFCHASENSQKFTHQTGCVLRLQSNINTLTWETQLQTVWPFQDQVNQVTVVQQTHTSN